MREWYFFISTSMVFRVYKSRFSVLYGDAIFPILRANGIKKLL